MSRVILFGFNPDTNEPLDSRMVVETVADRDAMNQQVLFEGLITYVKEDNTIYVYEGLTWRSLIGLTPEQAALIAEIPSKSTVVPILGNGDLVNELTIDGITYRIGGNIGPVGPRGPAGAGAGGAAFYGFFKGDDVTIDPDTGIVQDHNHLYLDYYTIDPDENMPVSKYNLGINEGSWENQPQGYTYTNVDGNLIQTFNTI